MSDTEADEATLTISQFGRMSQLSRKALRIYDDRGLLLPAHVDFEQTEMPAQRVASIRRHITVPAFHESIMPTLRQLFDHVTENGAQPAGDPVALYYGPVNEEDDGPVEIAVPFEGLVPPAGDIKVRELPAHKAVQVRTYDEYNEYPKLLEMWNALGRYVEEENLEPDWDQDMTTYEIWHDDETMTICWPVQGFVGA